MRCANCKAASSGSAATDQLERVLRAWRLLWIEMTFLRIVISIYSWRSMIFSENRRPSRIKSGTGIFGIML